MFVRTSLLKNSNNLTRGGIITKHGGHYNLGHTAAALRFSRRPSLSSRSLTLSLYISETIYSSGVLLYSHKRAITCTHTPARVCNYYTSWWVEPVDKKFPRGIFPNEFRLICLGVVDKIQFPFRLFVSPNIYRLHIYPGKNF